MASFKLNIADPKEGKTYQREVKDSEAQGFIGLNIGESVKGESIDMPGYELQITGGSDFCGFPMRRGILGIRKKINLYGGVGFRARSTEKGIRRRKTGWGHKINEKIVQINLKVTKEGSKKLAAVLGKEGEQKAEAAPKEETKKAEAQKETPKEAKKEPAKESAPRQEKKEHKPAEAKKE